LRRARPTVGGGGSEIGGGPKGSPPCFSGLPGAWLQPRPSWSGWSVRVRRAGRKAGEAEATPSARAQQPRPGGRFSGRGRRAGART
jgi:hypothetical protein